MLIVGMQKENHFLWKVCERFAFSVRSAVVYESVRFNLDYGGHKISPYKILLV